MTLLGTWRSFCSLSCEDRLPCFAISLCNRVPRVESNRDEGARGEEEGAVEDGRGAIHDRWEVCVVGVGEF